MGQLNFFEGDEEDNPQRPSFLEFLKQQDPIDYIPGLAQIKQQYKQAAQNEGAGIRRETARRVAQAMATPEPKPDYNEEIFQRAKQRLEREGINPFQQEPGYEPDPPTNPRVAPKPQPFNQDRYPELAQLGKQYDPNEVHYANELSPNDPRWEAFAKALGVNVDELKKKNLPSKFDQEYENMAQDMLRRVRERGYGESRLLNEKQADPDLVPIRAPYGGQRYYDPASSLGVDPIMAQQDWPGTPAS
jgi:hypothetical protein